MRRTRTSVMLLLVMTVSATQVLATVTARPVLKDDRSFVGTYLRLAPGSGITVTETLEIKADKTFLWTRNLPGSATVLLTGIWNVRGDVLVVVLGTRNVVQVPAGNRVVFDRKGKKLKGRIYDRSEFGSGELVFQRVDA